MYNKKIRIILRRSGIQEWLTLWIKLMNNVPHFLTESQELKSLNYQESYVSQVLYPHV